MFVTETRVLGKNFLLEQFDCREFTVLYCKYCTLQHCMCLNHSLTSCNPRHIYSIAIHKIWGYNLGTTRVMVPATRKQELSVHERV